MVISYTAAASTKTSRVWEQFCQDTVNAKMTWKVWIWMLLNLYCWCNRTRTLVIKLHVSTQWIYIYFYIYNIPLFFCPFPLSLTHCNPLTQQPILAVFKKRCKSQYAIVREGLNVCTFSRQILVWRPHMHKMKEKYV